MARVVLSILCPVWDNKFALKTQLAPMGFGCLLVTAGGNVDTPWHCIGLVVRTSLLARVWVTGKCWYAICHCWVSTDGWLLPPPCLKTSALKRRKCVSIPLRNKLIEELLSRARGAAPGAVPQQQGNLRVQALEPRLATMVDSGRSDAV